LLFNGKLRLKIASAASSGGQGRLKYFMYFPWPPLEAGLSILRFVSYLNEIGSYPFLLQVASDLLISEIITQQQAVVSKIFNVC
jgi:hypothetical protein